MLILNILAVVFGVTVLLLICLLLLPLDVLLHADSEHGFSVGVRVLGAVFGTKDSSSRHPLVRLVRKLIDREPSKLPQPSKNGTAVKTVTQHLDMVIPALERLMDVLRCCRVVQCHIRCVSGGDDAAIQYGKVCALLYPFVGYLQNCRRLKRRHTHLDVGWDYEADVTVFDCRIAVRVRVMTIAWAARRLLMEYKQRKGNGHEIETAG